MHSSVPRGRVLLWQTFFVNDPVEQKVPWNLEVFPEEGIGAAQCFQIVLQLDLTGV